MAPGGLAVSLLRPSTEGLDDRMSSHELCSRTLIELNILFISPERSRPGFLTRLDAHPKVVVHCMCWGVTGETKCFLEVSAADTLADITCMSYCFDLGPLWLLLQLLLFKSLSCKCSCDNVVGGAAG